MLEHAITVGDVLMVFGWICGLVVAFVAYAVWAVNSGRG